MGRQTPQLMGLTGTAAERTASLNSRTAALERRRASGAVTGGGVVTGDVLGTAPGALVINSASTPSVTRWGVGTAAHATTALTLQSAAATNFVVSDTAHGDQQQYFGAGVPLRWDLRHGTAAAPVAVGGSTWKLSRLSNVTDSATYPGTEFSHHSALQVVHVGTSTTKAQEVAISGVAFTSSEVPEAAGPPNDNPDTCGVIGSGVVTGAGVGRALGGYFEGSTITSAATPKLSAFETQARNFSGTNSTYDPAAGGANTTAIFATSGGPNHVSSVMRIGLSNTGKFRVGIGVTTQNPIFDATFRDDGNASYSLRIGGTHASAAIAVDSAAGQVLCGSLGTGISTKLLAVASATTEAAITAQAIASQAVNVFAVIDSAGAEMFGIGPTGNVRCMTGTVGIGGAAVANTGLAVVGTYSTAAVSVTSGAGKVLLGAASTALATKVLCAASNANECAVVAQGFASQAVNFFGCYDSAGAEAFGIASNNNLRTFGNVAIQNTAGLKIGTATTQKIGVWNVAPVAQPAAYTQTYATASRTHATRTAATLTDNTAGTATTTLEALTSGTVYATDVAAIRNNFADLAAMVNKLIVDQQNTAQVLNQMLDDDQLIGWKA